jgi:endonuclease YncB( thermonuclease family)
MSMHWNPGKEPVTIKGSRIRRDPAQVSRIRRAPPPVAKKVVARTDAEETWFGVAGVLAIAAALVAVIVGISYFTFFRSAPAPATSFGQCYNSEASNCVVDGGTAFIAGEKVAIAGLQAPEIRGAQCDAERSKGIDAAMRLAELLNSGPVKAGAPFQDELGRTVQTVTAGGKDVGRALIDANLALRITKPRKFC